MKKRITFGISVNTEYYNKLLKKIINGMEQNVGLFVKVIDDNNEITYRVNFKLGGGIYYGWLLTEMIREPEAVESLVWVCERDFPIEVKKYIINLMAKNKLVEKDMVEILIDKYSNPATYNSDKKERRNNNGRHYNH